MNAKLTCNLVNVNKLYQFISIKGLTFLACANRYFGKDSKQVCHCVKGNITGNCECFPGWMGKNCETRINTIYFYAVIVNSFERRFSKWHPINHFIFILFCTIAIRKWLSIQIRLSDWEKIQSHAPNGKLNVDKKLDWCKTIFNENKSVHLCCLLMSA